MPLLAAVALLCVVTDEMENQTLYKRCAEAG
jgi:hypothetical protein